MGELRRHVEADLSACQSALDEEAQADAAARSQYGDEWRMPTSATLAKHYWEKLHSYRCGWMHPVLPGPFLDHLCTCGFGLMCW
jgi:hypothetical protein